MKHITDIMEKDHGEIVSNLTNFITETARNKQDQASLLKMLDILQWEIDKHLTIEEKELFITFPVNNDADQRHVNKLMKQHEDIRDMLQEIRKTLKQGERIDTTNLRRAWTEHEQYESTVFYPKLEKHLSEKQKAEVIAKINVKVYE